MRAIYNGRHLYHSVDGLQHLEPASQSVYDPHKYGLPEIKKYPMPDAAHVKSAIKFFNYVSPKDEKALANAILQRMKEYGVTNVNVGPDNRFKKYYNPKNDFVRHSDNSSNFLIHSSGPWENPKYIDKVRDPNSPDGWRYIYEQGQEVGTRMMGQNENMHSINQGVVGTDQNQSSSGKSLPPTQQKKLQDFTEKPVSEVTGKKDSTTDDKTKKGKGGGSGGKGKSGSKSGKGSSGSMPKPGHAGKGKSKSGSSGSGSSSKDTEAAKQQQKKLAKQQKKAQAEAKAEQRREKERQERKEAEQFEQRRRENEKRWKAEQERMENYRDTSNYKIDKNDYQKLVDMLKGSDKEYAKQLLEGGKSKIDEYLDWLKESRKNNK